MLGRVQLGVFAQHIPHVGLKGLSTYQVEPFKDRLMLTC